MISHDDRYYHVADRILKFDEGQIVSDLTGRSFRRVHAVAVNRVINAGELKSALEFRK